ncbi:multidrug efflux SMR transporter [Fundidesulfovibrio butyratiphilus]
MGGAWTCLVLAGLFEIGWPVGLKMAQTPGRVVWGVVMAVACMGLSGALLWLAQRHIPMGTAYAVWTGIGAAGTFLIGVAFHGDPAGLVRLLGVTCIIGGVVLLKTAS